MYNKFYGQSISTGGGSKEQLDKILYDRYFQRQINGFFIECGANDGIFLSSCKFFNDIGWQGINIEPSKELYSKLIVNRPKNINLNIALSNKFGYSNFDFITFDNGGFSRLEESKQEAIDKTFNLRVFHRYPVITRTFADLVNKPLPTNIENHYTYIKEIDLFVLDVENHEIQVIEGMEGSRLLPKVFCIEHGHCGLECLKDKLKDKFSLDWNDSLNAIFLRR
jgi:FkbM family methyltransferase